MTTASARKVRFEVSDTDSGQRLDQLLAAHVPGLSRRKARVLLEIGGVFVDRRRVKVAGRKLRAGQIVEANLGGALERAHGDVGARARAQDRIHLPDYKLLHHDDHVIVVDKPAGLLSAATPESDRNNLADLLQRRFADAARVFVVHRLDLATSGILVFARSSQANRVLAARFRDHNIHREYLGVVNGVFPDTISRIDVPVAGRRAVTHAEVLEHFADFATMLRLRLETGRTHQIRIHTSHCGHPILGDRRYGEPTSWDPPRMALHATRLDFSHPASNQIMTFESPWPEDIDSWLSAQRGR